MPARVSRRVFLARSASATAACAATAFVPSIGNTASTAGLTLACRDAVLKETGKDDVFAAAKSIGAGGIEADLADDLSLPYFFHPSEKFTVATSDGIARVKQVLAAAGLRITAFCMHNKFDARPEMEVDWCAKTAAAAKALGIPAVRIDVVPRTTPVDKFLDVAVKILREVMAKSEATGVKFGVENHGRVTNDPDFLTPLFERVGSARLGLTLDTGNFYWFGHPLSKLYSLYERFAPRVVHTHCKSIKFPADKKNEQRPIGWEYAKYNCPVYEGDIDFRRVVQILRKAGYHNDLCIENESLRKLPADKRGEALAKEMAYLKQCQE